MKKLFFDITTRQNQQWVAYQADLWERQRTIEAEKVKPPPFITISREFGCSGFALGEELAQSLNSSTTDNGELWAVYDKKLLTTIADDIGVHETLLDALTTKARSEVTGFISNIIADIPIQASVFQKMVTAMRALAYQGRSIIIGRGAAVATRGLPGGFRVRVIAPDDWKVEQVMKMHGIEDAKKAKRVLEEATNDRRTFIKNYFKVPVTQSSLYHIILNQSMLPQEEMVEIIINAMKKRKMV